MIKKVILLSCFIGCLFPNIALCDDSVRDFSYPEIISLQRAFNRDDFSFMDKQSFIQHLKYGHFTDADFFDVVFRSCVLSNKALINESDTELFERAKSQCTKFINTVQEYYGLIPIKADSNGMTVTYTTINGTKCTRSGIIAFRMYNPGNLTCKECYNNIGYHVRQSDKASFTIFPDRITGVEALRRLLHSDDYVNKTIAQAITKYAPPSQNDTASYINKVLSNIKNKTGRNVTKNSRISELNDDEFECLMRIIMQIEGGFTTHNQQSTCDFNDVYENVRDFNTD